MLHPVLVLTAAHHLRHLPSASVQFRRRGGQAPLHVVPQGDQVAHHQLRPFKHMGVEPLQDKCPCRGAGSMSLMGHQKGFIDIPGSQAADRGDPVPGMETTRDGGDSLTQGDLSGLMLEPSR